MGEGSYDYALPLETSVLEIQDEADPKLSDPQIIDHFSTFMICDSVDNFRINNHRGEHGKIGNKLANYLPSKQHGKAALLLEGDFHNREGYSKGIFINFFMQAVSDFIEHIKSAAQNATGLFLQNQLGDYSGMQIWNSNPIRVHQCLSVVESFSIKRYSMLSTSACRLASMMLLLAPTVPHSSLPSPDSIRTRVLDAVPVAESRIRTL